MTIQVQLSVERGGFTLDADFRAPAQGIVGVLGPTGSGKTTLLRAMAGLEPNCRGHLKIEQQTWQDENQILAPHKRGVGFVFQDTGLFPNLNVKNNILYGFKRTPKDERKVFVEQAIELLQLGDLLSRETSDLSGGEKQRVAIARALLASPALLLMDEPLSGLDEASKTNIIDGLASIQQQTHVPIIYVSHIADELARLCDHLVLLDKGSVLAHGPLVELLTRTDLPLATNLDARAIIDGDIVSHDANYCLSKLTFSGGSLWLAGNKQPQKSCRVRIMARDVSLTLEPDKHSSILNVLPATIDSLTPISDGQVLVRLNLNGSCLLSQITRKSEVKLDLKPQKPVYAQIKSVALLN